MSVEMVSGCKFLKLWGAHQVYSETVILGDARTYCGTIAGTVENGSSVFAP